MLIRLHGPRVHRFLSPRGLVAGLWYTPAQSMSPAPPQPWLRVPEASSKALPQSKRTSCTQIHRSGGGVVPVLDLGEKSAIFMKMAELATTKTLFSFAARARMLVITSAQYDTLPSPRNPELAYRQRSRLLPSYPENKCQRDSRGSLRSADQTTCSGEWRATGCVRAQALPGRRPCVRAAE